MEDHSRHTLGLELYLRQSRKTYFQIRDLMHNLGIFESIGTGGYVILGCLSRNSKSTIPQLAVELGVSRQYVQKETSKLIASGLIRAEDNPKHKRSKLLSLTTLGRNEYEPKRRLYLDVLENITDQFSLIEISDNTLFSDKLSTIFKNRHLDD